MQLVKNDPGYRIFPKVLNSSECDALATALADSRIKRSRAGARHLMSIPVVSALANDPRLMTIAASALGGNPLPFRATLFEKSLNSNWLVFWHQDTALPIKQRCELAGWGPWSLKGGIHYAHAPTSALSRIVALRVHLDASTEKNGSLRVLPGSHSCGALADQEVFDLAAGESAVECHVPRGGILMMRPLLIHSSSKCSGSTLRRVLHIEYADSLRLDQGLELATA